MFLRSLCLWKISSSRNRSSKTSHGARYHWSTYFLSLLFTFCCLVGGFVELQVTLSSMLEVEFESKKRFCSTCTWPKHLLPLNFLMMQIFTNSINLLHKVIELFPSSLAPLFHFKITFHPFPQFCNLVESHNFFRSPNFPYYTSYFTHLLGFINGSNHK
jgi:hypothetical protein